MRKAGAKMEQNPILRERKKRNSKTTGLNVFVLFARAEANSWKSAMMENRLFKANTEQVHGPVR